MSCLAKALIFAGGAALLAMATTVSAQHAQAPAVQSAVPSAVAAPAEDSADVLFARWDTNHDKRLSPEEFRAGWESLQAAAALQRLHAQFALLDVDKNGCLSAAEYSHMALVQRAGKSAPPLSKFDTQRNQCLDFKEYVVVVNTLLGHDKK